MLSESSRTQQIRRQPEDYWHLYSLQNLSPNRFVSVVSDILRGNRTLVTTREGRTNPSISPVEGISNGL